jgi:hypothetical protein
MEHAWCRDPSRDAAVRAAEDGRTGPLPTLGECIERQKQTARPCGGTDPAPSRGERGAADTCMRTERVTLEITHKSPTSAAEFLPRRLWWDRYGESVRVVDTHAEEVAQSVAWEGARDAYRGRILRLTDERDKLRVRVAALEAASGGGEQPRGWLTEEEREALQWAADAAYDKQHPAEDTLRNILARSTPPEVVKPGRWRDDLYDGDQIVVGDQRDAEWLAALAAAGVAVKEVGRE